ncbi:hypothetical protein FA13DRAFT_1739922 [Coprinellus micaceus]|uniref:Nephrocystin 3-like N-terminal domain-containing protein n=1 Tax=Coprinellus micaceus TaxID=71717 RepID=A0A4Y7SQG3_COPMI|nr:hypothetical protein FA13DRAFT_1739922 [Coprinellus micaceus]
MITPASSPLTIEDVESYKPPRMTREVPPPKIQRIFSSDPKLELFAEEWATRAQSFYQMQKVLGQQSPPVELKPDERDELTMRWKNVRSAYSNFIDAIARKSGGFGTLATNLRNQVLDLEKVGKGSYSAAIKRSQLDRVYEKFVDARKRLNPLLNKAGVRGCDWWVRKEPMEHVTRWLLLDHEEQRILCLEGPPRCGKTVLLHSIARECDRMGSLSASYVVTKGLDRDSLHSSFLSTMVDELCLHQVNLKAPFATAFQQSQAQGADIFRKSLAVQVDSILRGALPHVNITLRDRPLLFVLDSLDYSGEDVLEDICDFMMYVIRYMPAYFIISSSSRRTRTVLSRKGLDSTLKVVEMEDYQTVVARKLAEWSAKHSTSSLKN